MDRRLRLLLIVAVFFGVPALLTLSLISSDHAEEAQRGLQPGGAIVGRVNGPDGEGLAGVEVGLLLDPSSGERPEAVAARALSGPEGRFELAAPKVDGRYTVVAGGGTWMHAARAFSFIGREEGKELVLRVLPGCELLADFTRADGSAPGPGSYDLQGRTSEWFSFFGSPPLRRQGRVEQGRLRIDALPPMHARLFVRFDSGESLEFELDLEPGRTEKKLRL